jgi:hypothetical protein
MMSEGPQLLLDILLCDMAPPIGIIQGYGQLLEEYLGQLAKQEQVETVIINQDLQITPQEALEWIREVLKTVDRLEMLRHKTHDDIRNLYSKE